MPLFEYYCKQCEQSFETLLRGAETPECPQCHGVELEKLLSTFAAVTGGARRASAERPGACSTCGDPRGPGACSMN